MQFFELKSEGKMLKKKGSSKGSSKKSLFNRKNWMIWLLIVLVLAAGGLYGYNYYQNQSSADVATGGGSIKVGSIQKDLIVSSNIIVGCGPDGADERNVDTTYLPTMTLPDIKLTKSPWIRKNVRFYYENLPIPAGYLSTINEFYKQCKKIQSGLDFADGMKFNFIAEAHFEAPSPSGGKWEKWLDLYDLDWRGFLFNDSLPPKLFEVILGPDVNDAAATDSSL